MHPNAEQFVKDIVWYIEARSTKDLHEPPSAGSAVVIQVKSVDNDLSTNHLLTCAHVVHSRKRNCWLPEILCWRPDSGYTNPNYRKKWPESDDQEDGIYLARINNELSIKSVDKGGKLLKEILTDSPAQNFYEDPGKDWVILDVLDPRFQSFKSACSIQDIEPDKLNSERARDSIAIPDLDVASKEKTTGKMHTSKRRQSLWIFGYPAGATEWQNGTPVQCMVSSKFHCRRMAKSPNMLKVEGAETRPGMSGGGLFTSKGQLAGIHRSSSDMDLSKGSIKISTVVDALWRTKHKFAPSSPIKGMFWHPWLQRISKKTLWIATTLLSLCLISIGITLFFWQSISDPEYFPSYASFRDAFNDITPGSAEWEKKAEQVAGTRIGGWHMWVHKVTDDGYICTGPNEAFDELAILVKPRQGESVHRYAEGRKLSSINGTLQYDGEFYIETFDVWLSIPDPEYFPSYASFRETFNDIAPETEEWEKKAEQVAGTRIGGWNMWVHKVTNDGYICTGPNEAFDELAILVKPRQGESVHRFAEGRKLFSINGTLKYDGAFYIDTFDYAEFINLSFEAYVRQIKNQDEVTMKDEYIGTIVHRWRGYCQKRAGDRYFFTEIKGDLNPDHRIYFYSNEEFDEHVEVEISGKITALSKRSTTIRMRE